MTATQPWQDVLLGSADQLDPTVISPTFDDALIEPLRVWLDSESAWDTSKPEGTPASERVRPARPLMYDYTGFNIAGHLTGQVAKYGTRLRRTIEQAQAAEVADAVRGIGPRWDSESRAIEASLARIDAFSRANPGSSVTS